MVGQRRWEHAAAAPNRSRVRRRCYQCRQLEMVARLPCGVVSRACRGHTATLARLLGRGLGLGGGGWGTTQCTFCFMPKPAIGPTLPLVDTTRSRTFSENEFTTAGAQDTVPAMLQSTCSVPHSAIRLARLVDGDRNDLRSPVMDRENFVTYQATYTLAGPPELRWGNLKGMSA